MPRSEQKGGNATRHITAVLTTIPVCFGAANDLLAAIGKVSELSDTGHAILSTFVFAFFIVYVVADMMYWRGEVAAIWVIGPLTILVAAYWWVGFLAIHHIPAVPFLPVHFYPPQWAYIVMFGWLAIYCAWDIIDARLNEYRDEKYLVAGAIVLLFGAALCLFLTLKGPRGT